MDFVIIGIIPLGSQGLKEFWDLNNDYTIALWHHLKTQEKLKQQHSSIPIAKLSYQVYQISQAFSDKNNRKPLEFDEFTLHKFKEFEEYVDFSQDFIDIYKELKKERIIPEWLTNDFLLHDKLKNLFKI